jgi:long-subunit fatty acid transport protein
VGAAWKASDRVSLHADLTQTYWRRFTNAFSYNTDGTFVADTGNTFNWRNTWKARLGSGFQWTEKTELLGGYSYDRYALDRGSVDLATTVDVNMHRLYLGAAHAWSPRWETIFGGVYGRGERSEANASYRLSGWQLMLESRLRVGPRS